MTETQTPQELPEPVADRCSLETRYEILADRRKRSVLTALADRDGAVDLDDLAHELVERGGTGYDGDVQTAEIALYHCDLPKLDLAGVVRFDREEQTAALA